MTAVSHGEMLAGTGKHLTPTQLRAWTGFLDAGRMLEQILANHLSECFDMTHREYEVMVRIDGAGGRQRMSVLASQIVASAPLITQTVKRLEDRGWVAKEPAANDMRGVDAVLQPDGRAALIEASGDHAALIKELLLEPVGDGELSSFADAISRVADHFRNHRSGKPCSNPDCSLS